MGATSWAGGAFVSEHRGKDSVDREVCRETQTLQFSVGLGVMKNTLQFYSTVLTDFENWGSYIPILSFQSIKQKSKNTEPYQERLPFSLDIYLQPIKSDKLKSCSL